MICVLEQAVAVWAPNLTKSQSIQIERGQKCALHIIMGDLYCQTLGLVLRLRVDFVLPLSQQEEQEQEEEEQEQPLTKIYQKGVY